MLSHVLLCWHHSSPLNHTDLRMHRVQPAVPYGKLKYAEMRGYRRVYCSHAATPLLSASRAFIKTGSTMRLHNAVHGSLLQGWAQHTASWWCANPLRPTHGTWCLCIHAVLPMDQLFSTLLEHLQHEVELLLRSNSNTNKLKVCMLPAQCTAPLACLQSHCYKPYETQV